MMMPCLSASRGYRPSPTSTTTPPPTFSSSSSVVSDTTKSTSISSSEISSSLFVSHKKPRTRRKRPHEVYNEAAAALSAIYPKIFCQDGPRQGRRNKKMVSKSWKRLEPLRFKEEPEFSSLHEVPTLIGGGRERDVEETELLCNEGTPPELKCGEVVYHRRQISSLLKEKKGFEDDGTESKSPSSSALSEASVPTRDIGSIEYEWCLLDSDENGGIDGVGDILSSIMGSDTNPDFSEEGLGVYGLEAKGRLEREEESEYGLQCSAIRALRRASDQMICPVLDYSFPRLRLSDKIMADKERNVMSFCSLDWLKRDDGSQQRIKLKLNYEDVLNAWSDRGPLYTDAQVVPDDSFSDSVVQFIHPFKSTLAES